MNSSLLDIYFARALDHAENSNISAALRFASLALGMMPEDEKTWKLAGLCYYQLGNNKMTEFCFGQLSDEREELLAAVLRKQDEMKPAVGLAEQGDYKKAAAYLAAVDKTIGQWNYLGCLYAVLGQREKAADCFVEALKMDHSNAFALNYLSGLDQIKKRKWWKIWQ